MSYDAWLEKPYQEQEEVQISFEDFCKVRYEETFNDKDDDQWEDYKDWVSEHYKELEEEWKYD